MEVADNVIPSSNSEMAKNLFFYLYFDNADYSQKSNKCWPTCSKMSIIILSIIQLGRLEMLFIKPLWDCYCGFNETPEKLSIKYLPNAIFLGGKTKDLALLEGKFKGKLLFMSVK
jgi:hypothetical protein